MQHSLRILLLLLFINVINCSVLVIPIATGFAWAENLIFDGNGNLFVSDVTRGEIYRIYYSETNHSYITEAFLSNQMDRY